MQWITSGFLFMALLLSVVTAPDSSKLPKVSIPLKYDLSLNFAVYGIRTIIGTVKIDIEVVEDTEAIILHSRDLTITNSTLTKTTSGAVLDHIRTLQPENDFLLLNVTSRPLLKGDRITAEIAFTGTLQLAQSGIYRTSYTFNSTAMR